MVGSYIEIQALDKTIVASRLLHHVLVLSPRFYSLKPPVYQTKVQSQDMPTELL